MENFLLFYLITINIVGFIMMHLDKKRAINNQWRIKESTLLYVAMIGGSIGTLIGMNAFRHKTKHIKFTLGIPCIILLQLALVFVTN